MKLVPLEGVVPGAGPKFTRGFSNFRLFLIGDDSEPKYDGYQIWIHQDIPDYTDMTKAGIQF